MFISTSSVHASWFDWFKVQVVNEPIRTMSFVSLRIYNFCLFVCLFVCFQWLKEDSKRRHWRWRSHVDGRENGCHQKTEGQDTSWAARRRAEATVSCWGCYIWKTYTSYLITCPISNINEPTLSYTALIYINNSVIHCTYQQGSSGPSKALGLHP